MADDGKTKQQLCEELAAVRQKVAELEQARGQSAELAGAMRVLLDSTDDAVLLTEIDGTVVVANEALARRFGQSAEGIVGKNIFDFFPVKVAQSRQQMSQQVARTRQPLHYFDERAGRIFENHHVPICRPDEEVRQCAVFAKDVTEAKQTEVALRESEEKYRTIFRAESDAIFLVDEETGALLDANPAAERLYGYTRQELLSLRAWDLSAEPEQTRKVIKLRGQSVAKVPERIHRHKDGTTIIVEIAASNFDMEGRKVNVSTIRDIRDRKQAEEERRTLERQVLEKQKLESLGVLAGGIAHDFNNLLTGLLGNTELALLELPQASALRPLLKDIQHAGRRAADLTRQMLAYSGKGKFIVQDVDVNAVIEDMSSLLSSSTTKKVELELEPAADLPWVRADVTQLGQIVLNLVSNAAEAMQEQGGTVVLRTYGAAGDLVGGGAMRSVVIEVTDTGIGMSPETKARIFDPFFTTKFTGRGLGLAAVQGIVRGHDGAIEVDSAPGKGTVFRVALPALERPAESHQPSSRPPSDWRSCGAILVVDDEAIVRKVAERMLSQTGFSVVLAKSGAEAIEIFRERHVDIGCVLLDLSMPHMDGEETYEELRRIDDGVPVILSSGFSQRESTKRFGEKDLAGFVQKPYRLGSLQKVLQLVFG